MDDAARDRRARTFDVARGRQTMQITVPSGIYPMKMPELPGPPDGGARRP
jgi:hypothetical protein